MLESFSPPCEKEQLTMECTCEGMVFRSRSSSVIRPGWCGVFSRREERDGDEPEGKVGMAVFAEGETLPVMGRGLVAEEDPSQAALHGSDPAGRHGDLRKGHYR